MKKNETLQHSVVKKAEIYNLEMRDMNREFNVEVNKIEKNVTLEILNPNY